MTLAVALCALAPTAALASPEWGIALEHHNAYGAQRESCPGGHESGPAEAVCGVDPFTDSGTNFDRGSGFNEYRITVSNTAPAPEPPGLHVGENVTCEAGNWQEEPSLTYQWLRNGSAIAGATESVYHLQPEDEGKYLECEVTGTNLGGAASFLSKAVVVAPAPAVSAPSVTELPEVTEESATVPVGEMMTCSHGEWTSDPTFTYQWLRNGVPIGGATASTYTTTATDESTSLQCFVSASNAGGTVVATNRYPTPVGPEPSQFPPYTNHEIVIPVPSVPTNETTGAVSVADHLPQGLVFAGAQDFVEASGTGWACSIENATTVTCSRSDALAPGESYPPIILHVHAENDAPLGSPPSGGVTDTASVYGGGASPDSAFATDPATVVQVPFGVQSFTTKIVDELEAPFTQANGHPWAANATLVFNYVPDDAGRLRTTEGSPKNITTELPPGFIGDPEVASKCSESLFERHLTTTPCPLNTAVGYIVFTNEQGIISGGQANPFANHGWVPIYNVKPTPGNPASFGFIGGASFAHYLLEPRLRSDGDYGITIASDDTATPTLLAASVTFCDAGVVESVVGGGTGFVCGPSQPTDDPFLTNVGRCAATAPFTTLSANTYEQPSEYATIGSYTGTASGPAAFAGQPASTGTPDPAASFVTGCGSAELATSFGASTISLTPATTQADSPSGIDFELKVPQTSEASKLATPELRNATVTLPPGMSLSPSAANGLESCTDAQFGLESHTEPAKPGSCPAASRVGTVTVTSPLLEKPLEGGAFVGEPECAPCTPQDASEGHIFRLFLEVADPTAGVLVKLAGHVSAEPTTGQLTATFSEQPQLPFGELRLHLKEGARAPLAAPLMCGEARTTSDLTPWSDEPGINETQGTPDVAPSSAFTVDWNGAGEACPASLPFAPVFAAQAASSAAGATTPFTVSITREDREQDLSGITMNTPPGLLGVVSQVTQCGEPEASQGICPDTSRIGTVTAGAGPGSRPFYLEGPVYLTGPYKGAPFGLSIAVPAKAGPFNLGTVIVRAAVSVNPSTTALTVTSDPLPQVVDGVPLRLRDVRVRIDRAGTSASGFILDPTDCAAQSITATITGQPASTGEAAKTSSASAPFASGGCSALPFAPGFAASTEGSTSKASGASLNVRVSQATGEANIAKVDVQLPTLLAARLTTLQQACTEAQFGSNPAGCPAGSDVGTATAVTPILNSALAGPAYLVSHGGAKFPDLEVVLQGEGVTVILDSGTEIRESAGRAGEGTTFSHFDTVPDAPVSSFDLNLPEQGNSLLAAPTTTSLCSKSMALGVTATGQSGKQLVETVPITVTGCPRTSPSTAKPKPKVESRRERRKKALKACKTKKPRKKRATCEKQALKKYGTAARSSHHHHRKGRR